MSTRHDMLITVDGDRLAVWHYEAASDALAGPAGRPCVVMAHGFGGTRDSGMESFAEHLRDAGTDVLLFDYRHFGASQGEPRQLLSPKRQQADYRAVIAQARTLPDIDPDRIVAWGVSFSGGHVLEIGATDDRLAAVISVTPAVDGLAAMVPAVRRDGLRAALRLTAAGMRDAAAAARRREPELVPTVGRPGEYAALAAPGMAEAIHRLAGPTWRNEVCARILLQLGSHRPIRHADRIRCPVLMQVADDDGSAPAAAAMRAAAKARAVVHHYPCDHMDVWPGYAWHEPVIAHQVAFLQRVLTPASAGVVAA